MVRHALDEARESLASAATNSGLREFVERLAGPMVLRGDGTVAQKEPAAEEAGDGVKELVAGARYVPFHIRRAFWQRFRVAA